MSIKLMCSNIKKSISNPAIYNILYMTLFIIILSTMSYDNTFAVDSIPSTGGTEKIDMLTGLIAGIFLKIGAVVLFLGGLQVAWGIKSDSPDSKANGVKTAAAGAAVAVIAGSYNMFIS